MSALLKNLRRLGSDQLLLGLTGAVAVAVGIFDFLGWLQFSVGQLLQMGLVGIGLLMSAMVIQGRQQRDDLVKLEYELEKS